MRYSNENKWRERIGGMTFTLGVPQIIYLAIVVFNIVYAILHNGEEQPKRSAWVSLIGSALGIALLYWGGFFS